MKHLFTKDGQLVKYGFYSDLVYALNRENEKLLTENTLLKDQVYDLEFRIRSTKTKQKKPEVVKETVIVEKPVYIERVVYRTHPSKAKKNAYNREFNAVRESVLERDGFKCTVCGAEEGLHAHHIIERSQGGTNDISNLTTLCKHCHTEAHKDEPIGRLMQSWYK